MQNLTVIDERNEEEESELDEVALAKKGKAEGATREQELDIFADRRD